MWYDKVRVLWAGCPIVIPRAIGTGTYLLAE